MEEVAAVAAEKLEGPLGQVQLLDMISRRAGPISLLGAVPRCGKPTPTLSNSKVVIVPLSRVMVVGMVALRLRMAPSSTVRKEAIRQPLATLSNNHKITTTLSIIKANMPSSNKSARLPFNPNLSVSFVVNLPLKDPCSSHFNQ